MKRDYDKAEQECQRYKTLYDAAKEDVSHKCHCDVIYPWYMYDYCRTIK